MTALHTNSTSTLLELSDERDAWMRRLDAAYRSGYRDGGRGEYERGYVQAALDMKAAEHAHVASLAVYLRKWHVCCGPCRRSGHQDGCTRCEDRTRATFGNPHPDDYTPRGCAA